MSASVDYDRIIRKVMPQALVSVSGVWHRCVPDHFARKPRPWKFSAKHPSRFYDEQRSPYLCHLYLAESDKVARYESRSLFWDGSSKIENPSKNMALISYKVNLKHVFDLPSVMPILLTAQEQTGDWQGYKGRLESKSTPLADTDCKVSGNNSDPICPTQRFGKAISRIYLEKQHSIDGFIYISAKHPTKRCLMVFIDDDRADAYGVKGQLKRL